MIDPATAVGLATAGVILFLCPAMALFFGGLPTRRDAAWLGAFALASVAVATGEWMLLGQPPALALLQGALAAAAVLTVASIGIRAGRRPLLAVILGLWLVAVVVPLGFALFDVEDGWIAAGIGTLDFAGACVLGVIPGTAAIAMALALRWTRAPVIDQPRRPWWLFLCCAIAGVLGFLAVAVGAELVIDETTMVLVVNTLLGVTGGIIGWTAAQVANVHRASVAGVVAGAFAGILVVLPASPWLEPVAVLVLAVIASIVGHITAIAFRRRDEKRAWASLIGICLVPAAIGMIAAGIVANGQGLLYSGHADLAEAQLQGLAIVLVVSFAATLAIAWPAYAIGGRIVSAVRR